MDYPNEIKMHLITMCAPRSLDTETTAKFMHAYPLATAYNLHMEGNTCVDDCLSCQIKQNKPTNLDELFIFLSFTQEILHPIWVKN